MSGTIARKTASLHVHVFGLRPICAVNFSRDRSSGKLIKTFSTQTLILETRDLKLSRITYQVSRLEELSTYF